MIGKGTNIKHYILHYMVLAIFMAVSALSFSQTAILKGRVTSEKGEGMEYVSVRLANTPRPIGTITNAKGYYQFNVPANKEITVLFSFTGYESYRVELTLADNEVKELDCSLKPHAKVLEGVTIKDDKVRKSTFTSINIEKIDNVAGPNSGVESLVKTLPDVSSSNELSSQYSVRGGSFDENLVYINDVEIYRPFLVRSGQQEGLSIINPDMVERVMFSPGGFEAKYSDKMSSVLDITYKRPKAFGGKAITCDVSNTRNFIFFRSTMVLLSHRAELTSKLFTASTSPSRYAMMRSLSSCGIVAFLTLSTSHPMFEYILGHL
jgi:hypothetical protein